MEPMAATIAVGETDLFVLLDRDFRRRTRSCPRCTFSLPFRLGGNCPHGSWGVIASEMCSDFCSSVLEDVVSKLQRTYRLR
jgi:hypothetical protein